MSLARKGRVIELQELWLERARNSGARWGVKLGWRPCVFDFSNRTFPF